MSPSSSSHAHRMRNQFEIALTPQLLTTHQLLNLISNPKKLKPSKNSNLKKLNPKLTLKLLPLPNYFIMHKVGSSLNKRAYSICSQRIWYNCEYILESLVLIYFNLVFPNYNTYRGSFNKGGSRECINT